MKNVNPVGWFDISVSDLQRAKQFYETVFDIKLIDFPAEWGKQSAFPSDYKSLHISGALVEKERKEIGGNATIVYFVSEDCTTETEKVVIAGGKVLAPKKAIGEFGFVALVEDTEGNTIGIHSRK